MIIKDLEISELGLHKSLTAKLGAPVIGLLGPNGSGKSTILLVIEWLFTGKLPEPAESWVRYWGMPGAASNGWARCSFVKNGVTGTIFRQTGKTPKRELVWDGQTFKSAKDIEKALTDILGASKEALSNAVFLPQGSLDTMLFGPQADREGLFVRLLLLSHFEKTVNIIDGKIKHLSAGLQDFTTVVDELNRQRAEAESAMGLLEVRQKNHRDWSSDIKALREVQAAVEEANSAIRSVEFTRNEVRDRREKINHAQRSLPVQGSLSELRSSEESKRTERHTSKSTVTAQEGARDRRQTLVDLGNELNQQEAYLSTTEAKVRDAHLKVNPAALQAVDDRLTAYEAKLRAQTALETAEKALMDTSALVEENAARATPFDEAAIIADEVKLEQLREVAFQAQLKHDIHKAAVKSGASGGTCPICEHAVAASALTDAHVVELHAAWSAASAAVAKLKAQIDLQRKTLREFDAARAKVNQQMATVTIAYGAAMGVVPSSPDEDVPALKAQRQEMSEAAGRLDQLEQQLTQQKAQVATSRKRFDQLTTQDRSFGVVFDAAKLEASALRVAALDKELEPYAAAIALLEPLENEVNRLEGELTSSTQRHATKANLAEKIRSEFSPPLQVVIERGAGDLQVIDLLQEKQDAYLAMVGEIKQARVTADGLRDRQNELDARIAKDAGKRQLIDDLRRLKDTFTRSGLPLAFIRYQFAKLAAVTRLNLSKMESNFTVESDPDRAVSFLFTRVDDGHPYTMTQDRLSGGQKVRLTINFLKALQQCILPEVGFLVLDEPSQGLDDESVEALKELLLEMGGALSNTESQILVCDHKPQLEPAFGDIVRTSK